MYWRRLALSVVMTTSLTGCGAATSEDAQDATAPEPAVLTMPADWKFILRYSLGRELGGIPASRVII
jgi:hypothetical protein